MKTNTPTSAKRKVEIELDIPEGYEVCRYDYPKSGEHFINASGFHDCNIRNEALAYKFIVLKPIEPPLELETDVFARHDKLLSGRVCIQTPDTGDTEYLYLGVEDFHTPAEARDLAKILNYWAEKGKLPERVVVKALPKQGGE